MQMQSKKIASRAADVRQYTRCYVAGKIGDLPEYEYTAKFREAAKVVREMGMRPVVPIDLPHMHNKSWAAYMREDIAALMQCSAIYVIRGYETSKGALLELHIAQELNMTIIHQ